MQSSARTLLLGVIVLGLSAAFSDAAAQVKACALITAAEAAQILAKPAVAKAQVISTEDDNCSYLGSGFDVHTEVLKSVPGWSGLLKDQIKQGKAESVSGIGDEAAYTKDGNHDYVLVARKGDRIVTVTMFADNWSAADARPKAIKLLTLAVGKLR